MTIGTKLMAGSVSMLALTLLSSVSSLYTTETLGNEMSKTAAVTSRNLELAGAAAADAANMLSAERGLLLRLALGDQPRAIELHQDFAQSAKNLDHDLAAMQTLAASEENRAATANMRAALTAWLPGDDEMWQLCSKQDYQGAFKVFDSKVAPRASEMQKAASAIVAGEHRALEQDKSLATELPVRSRWIALGLIMLSVLMGVAVVFTVRGVTASLRNMALLMSGTADEVVQASRQISTLSEHLATGAGDQAASLEETTASSAEISSMTQRNAEHAHAAAAIVAKVDEQVHQTNKNLGEMIKSMQNITSSSKKIAQIITVIEQIAFQTNLLALNAAVEAARAGEAGLGFAVVADEVRTLAQRCSEAARDTGALINEAVSSSNEGSAKLNDVAAAISAITESASQVREMVNSVNAASQEQARGITQISQGLARMEKVTQQTAASAQEGMAASRQMDSQAHALRQVVDDLRNLVDQSAEKQRSGHSELQSALTL